MKKQSKPWILPLGIILFALGIACKFIIPESAESLQALTVALTGFGAGIVGVGVAGGFAKKIIDRNPEKAREYEIAEKDERNIRVREKAGYSTWYISLFVQAIAALALLVLDYTIPCLLVMLALLVHVVSLFVNIYIHNKKM